MGEVFMVNPLVLVFDFTELVMVKMLVIQELCNNLAVVRGI